MTDNKTLRRGWLALLALTLINILNYVDRNIVSALAPLIQRDLHFNDLQTGLIGSAFIFAYTLAAPLFGIVGDRGPRLKTMSAGVLLWSAATAWTGFAGTFVTQFVTRVTVGFGEAAYSVIAPSVISDYFARATRGRVFAIYSCAIPVGSALGYVLAGLLEPVVGWQKSFFIVGIPGALIALLMLFMRDPERGTVDDVAPQKTPHLAGQKSTWSKRHVRLLRNGSFVYTVLGYAAYTFVVGGLAFWMPAYITRYFDGVSLAKGNIVFGGITVVGGFIGTVLGGYLSDHVERVSGNGYMKVSILSMMCAVPLFVLVLTMKNFESFAAVLFVLDVALFLCISPLDAAVMNSVRPDLRATASALTIFLIHVLGDGISRVLMGQVSDVCGLKTAVAMLPFVLALAGLLWAWGMISHFHPLAWPKGALALPRYQAHRGFRPRGEVQENTLDAFRLAQAHGAIMVECDVQLSLDRKVVIFHDEDLSRLAGSKSKVTELAASDLNKQARVPLLRELLVDADCPKLVNIELKTSELRGRSGLERELVEVVKKENAEGRVLFSSFNPFALRRLAKLAPEIPRALLVTEEQNKKNGIYLKRMWFAFLARPHIVHLDQEMLSQDRLANWNERSLPIAAWTVNDANRARELESSGIRSLITDHLYAD